MSIQATRADAIRLVNQAFAGDTGRRDALLAQIDAGHVDPASVIERFGNITNLGGGRVGSGLFRSVDSYRPNSDEHAFRQSIDGLDNPETALEARDGLYQSMTRLLA